MIRRRRGLALRASGYRLLNVTASPAASVLSCSGRLTDVVRDGALAEHYEYDANGNRITSANDAGTVSATNDAQDRIETAGGVAYTFGANGDLEERFDTGSLETTRYNYDALGNLRRVELPDGRVLDYLVDPSGRRVAKSVDGVRERVWLWASALQPVAQLDETGAIVQRYVYSGGNSPALIVTPGSTYRIVKDHLGSVRLVVDVATGAVVQELEYDSWGRVLVDTNPGWQPFGYAGGLYDADTGLVRFGARDYDAETGRWTSKDPIGLSGGLDMYAYVHGDPINRVDKTGRYAGDGFERYSQLRTPEDAPLMLVPTKEAGSVAYWDEVVTMFLNQVLRFGRNEGDAFVVYGHGAAGTLDLLGVPNVAGNQPREVAEWIRSQPGYEPGMPIQLNACEAGIETGIAQTLSKEMHTRVSGPTDQINVYGGARNDPEYLWNVYEDGLLVGH